MKHSRQCFIGYPNTSNFIKNALLPVIIFNSFLGFLDIPMKHCLSCLIYYMKEHTGFEFTLLYRMNFLMTLTYILQQYVQRVAKNKYLLIHSTCQMQH